MTHNKIYTVQTNENTCLLAYLNMCSRISRVCSLYQLHQKKPCSTQLLCFTSWGIICRKAHKYPPRSNNCLKKLYILSSLSLVVNFLTENEKECVYGNGASHYRNTGVKYLCVLNCVSETLLTCPWK